MNHSSIPVILTFTGTTVLVAAILMLAYETFFQYRASLGARLHEVNAKRAGKLTSLLDFRQLGDASKGDWKTWARDRLRQAGLSITVRTLVLVSFGISISASIAASLLTRHLLTALVSAICGASMPLVYVWLRRRQRFRQLALQLPDVLDFICRAVSAGQTMPASFQMVADDFPAPISDEFRYCYEQQNLGISYSTALRNLARSSGFMELRILVVALLVQARSGGNLTDLLQNLAAMLRKRIVLQQKVRAITGEGRMQAVILLALPFVVFAAMYLLNRNYAEVLLDRPWLLVGCMISQGFGAALIYKFIQIDY